MADIKRDLTPSEIDALVAAGDWFPFVEVWSKKTPAELFAALVASPYGSGKTDTIPTMCIRFIRPDFASAIPDRFRKPIPQMQDSRVILTQDTDLKDYREMNAIGEFFMEDLRLTSSKRQFMKTTPIEMWDSSAAEIVAQARRRYGSDAGPYEIRNTISSVTRESNPFRPSIALAVYSMFNAKSILDMSSGWGDRLLGAMAWAHRSKLPVRYQGYDPFCKLQERYAAMIHDFGNIEGTRFEVTCAPFEEAAIEEDAFDLAFTSPPYFDFEEYGFSPDSADQRVGQSTVRYPNLQDWIEGFLRPMMYRAAQALRPNGYLAINIEKPFVNAFLESLGLQTVITPRVKIEYLGILGYRSNEARDTITHPIFVWRRSA